MNYVYVCGRTARFEAPCYGTAQKIPEIHCNQLLIPSPSFQCCRQRVGRCRRQEGERKGVAMSPVSHVLLWIVVFFDRGYSYSTDANVAFLPLVVNVLPMLFRLFEKSNASKIFSLDKVSAMSRPNSHKAKVRLLVVATLLPAAEKLFKRLWNNRPVAQQLSRRPNPHPNKGRL